MAYLNIFKTCLCYIFTEVKVIFTFNCVHIISDFILKLSHP